MTMRQRCEHKFAFLPLLCYSESNSVCPLGVFQVQKDSERTSVIQEETHLETIRISVRNLVEFVMRSGDLDNRRSQGAKKEAMQAGSRLHRKKLRAQMRVRKAQSRGKNYRQMRQP